MALIRSIGIVSAGQKRAHRVCCRVMTPWESEKLECVPVRDVFRRTR